MKAQNTRRRSWITVLVILAIVVVFLLLIDIGAVIDELRNADWFFLGLATAFLIIGFYIQALRWRHLLGKIPSISYTFHTINVSTFTNLMTFIPSITTRSFFMGEYEGLSIPQSASSLLITFVFDLVIKLIAILGAMVLLAPIGSNIITVAIFIGVIILIFAGVLLLVHNVDKIISLITTLLFRLGIFQEEQADRMLTGLADGLKEVGTTKKVAVIFLYSLITWSFFIAFYIFGLLAFNIKPGPEVLIASALVAAFFVNPTGPYLPGIFNFLLVVPIALISNIDIESLVAYSIVIYAVLLILWIVLGIWAMRHYKLTFSELRNRAKEGIDQVQNANDSRNNNLPELN
ncbi:MAG: flippase-like domain-containing protein [Chloroflexota bacterium]|nr:MAG: flippase-like domain-containing protein [Chloroflexota bacterium]